MQQSTTKFGKVFIDWQVVKLKIDKMAIIKTCYFPIIYVYLLLEFCFIGSK